jgi:hypothetical protein
MKRGREQDDGGQMSLSRPGAAPPGEGGGEGEGQGGAGGASDVEPAASHAFEPCDGEILQRYDF